MTVKTTLYLPDELKRQIEEVAGETGRAEAEVIRTILREGLERRSHEERRRPPRFGFLHGPANASRVDEILAEDGFGDWRR